MRVLTDWELTPDRAAVHLPTRTAVAADLHLGYAEARQRDGDAVPAVPVAAMLAPLRRTFDTYQVRRLVIGGDLFEAGPSQALIDELLAWLKDAGVELAAVVPGNHDGDIQKLGRLSVHPDGFDLDGWRVVHGDAKRPTGRVVQGHEHPILRWGNGLTAPCYLVGRRHLVLPAFSTDAAGANVLKGGDWPAYRCCAIAGADVLDFGKLADLRPKR
jgi:putative SbcD/Mre11-related phosphoesterase